MAIVNVTLADTFDQWRVKTNSMGTQTGDLTSLATTDKTSIVAAINEIFNKLVRLWNWQEKQLYRRKFLNY